MPSLAPSVPCGIEPEPRLRKRALPGVVQRPSSPGRHQRNTGPDLSSLL